MSKGPYVHTHWTSEGVPGYQLTAWEKMRVVHGPEGETRGYIVRTTTRGHRIVWVPLDANRAPIGGGFYGEDTLDRALDMVCEQ